MKKLPAGPTAKGSADWFTGDVYVDGMFGNTEPSRMTMANVHFTPGARTVWHRHAGGQALACTEGLGLVVNRDGDVVTLRSGTSAWVCPDEDHWHGAVDDHLMVHVAALEKVGDGDPTTWLEPVTDEDYAAAVAKAKDQA